MARKKKPVELRTGLPVIRIIDVPAPDFDDPGYDRWVDSAIWRMGEIERMAGQKMTPRHSAALVMEHFQLGNAVAGLESRRLQLKRIMMETK